MREGLEATRRGARIINESGSLNVNVLSTRDPEAAKRLDGTDLTRARERRRETFATASVCVYACEDARVEEPGKVALARRIPDASAAAT